MSFGLDFVTAPSIAAMKEHDPVVAFVCRYLSEVNDETKIKLLTAAEAKADSAAGIAIVSNYEWTGTTALGGYNAGVYDARIAAQQHTACGGPADRPIYFSIDWDAQPGQMPVIIDYFHGVASIVSLDRTGAYGSYEVIKALLNAGAIKWAWQTYAWSGGQWDPRAHIRQYQNGVTFGWREVDYDESMQADFGQWVTLGGYMIPAGWKDNGTTLTAPNGVEVIQGFREWVLSHPWDSGNWPIAASAGRNPLEDSNASLGGGTFQIFRWSMLEWTTDRGVFVSWIGQELLKARQEIDALKAVPPTTAPVDTSLVESDINAIVSSVTSAIASTSAKALADLKKL